MIDTPPSTRLTLRDLPLAGKLVVSVFLISVGIGYLSALMQLRMSTAGKGEAAPTPARVVARYSGKTWPPQHGVHAEPKSRLQAILEAPPQAPWGNTNMVPAFTTKSGDWPKNLSPEALAQLTAERDGERQSLIAWVKAGAPEAAYTNDAFAKPSEVAVITPKYLTADGMVKIASILNDRCARCHSKGEEQEKFPLETYAQVKEYTKVLPATDPAKGEQISVKALTQSTHVHMLGFSMLYLLTGFIFAFTSYPLWLRATLGPLVLLAQIADISCWWLARLESVGPYFALAIMGTGAVVGLGLAAQIVLSLFNMFGRAGKVVLAGLFGLGVVLIGLIQVLVLLPMIEEEKRELEALQKENATVTNRDQPQPPVAPQPPKPQDDPKPADSKQDPPKPAANISHLQRIIEAPEDLPWKKDGSMAAAFTKKSVDWPAEFKKKPGTPEELALRKKRDGERLAMIAWIKAGAPREAYEKDAFDKPAEITEITEEFLEGGKVKIQSIITERCARCHGEGAEQEASPLENYEQISKYLKVEKPAAPSPAAKSAPAPAPKSSQAPASPPAPVPAANLGAWKAENDSLRQRAAQLEQQLRDMTVQYDTVKAQIKQVEQKEQQARAEVSKLVHETMKWQTEVEALRKQVSDLRASEESAKQALALRAAELKLSGEKIIALTRENGALKNQLTERTQLAAEMEKTKAALDQQRKLALDQLQQIRQQLEAALKERPEPPTDKIPLAKQD